MTSFDDVINDEYIPTDRPMRIGRYVLGAVIGEGKSALLRRGTRDGDKKRVAVKVLNKLVGHRGTLIQLQFHQEVEALRRLKHEHIVTMHEFLHSQRRFYIVMELLKGEILSQYILHKGGLSEELAQQLSSQLTSAIAYMHTNLVVHRDLKPENIILDTQRMHTTIIDFGLSACSTSPSPHLVHHCGTLAYMAPEVTNTTGYGCAVDVWSLGVSIVEMLLGYPPVLNDLHQKGNYPKLVQRRKMFAKLPKVSKECLHFLDKTLQIYPERRITAAEAVEHDWIKPILQAKMVDESDKTDPQQSIDKHVDRTRKNSSS